MDKLVQAYMQLRHKRDVIEAKAKAEVTELRASMEKIEAYMLQKMEEDGVTSYKTSHGTAFKSVSDYAFVSNWDDALEYIKNNSAWQLLERRVNKLAVRSYLDEKLPLPPGVSYGTKIDVQFRKPPTQN